MPDQQGHDAVTQHDHADQHAGRPHLEAADEERLVRVIRMTETPEIRRHHDRKETAGAQPIEEGDGEHPADAFLRDRRQESDQEHRRPRKRRVEHVAVGHVRRRPGPEVARHDVEHGLVCEEERGERVAEDDRPQEAPGLDAPRRERPGERELAREPLAVDRLRRRHDDRDPGARPDGREDPEHDVARQVRRQRARRVVAVEGERDLVEHRKQRQDEGDAAEGGDQAPGNVLAHDLGHEHDEHGEDRHEEAERRDLARRLVLGSEALVVSDPRLGHVHELVEPEDLVPGHRRRVPDRGLRVLHTGALVDEGPVRPVRPRHRRRLDRGQRRLRKAARGQELQGERSRLVLRQPRAGSVLRDDRAKADQVAQRRQRHALLFLDAGAEPAHLPLPDLRLRAVDAACALETELPLEVHLRGVVHVELAGEPGGCNVAAALVQEFLGEDARLPAVDLELDRRLGKGPPKEGGGDSSARSDDEKTGEEEA